MNNSFAQEIALVQNKALGSALMFKTIKSFEKNSSANSGCPIHLLFLVLPILLQKDICSLLASTNPSSGIRKFSNKFTAPNEKKADLLFRIHGQTKLYRELSWESFLLGIKANMFTIIPDEGKAITFRGNIPAKYEHQSIKPMFRGADRLGKWFSQKSMFEIANTLKVRF